MQTNNNNNKYRNNKQQMSSISFLVCIAPIKRITENTHFSPGDYEVCLTRESQIGTWSLPLCPLTANVDPGEVGRDYLRQIAGIPSGQIFSLDVTNEIKDSIQYITMCYVVATQTETVPQNRPSIEVKFEKLSDTLDTSEDATTFKQSHTQVLRAIVSWLRDQHVDKLVRLDKIFKGGSESFSMPISIRAMLGNPLSERNLSPQEDKLLVSLDNPVFQFLVGGQLNT